jgi:hypothetical protein
LDSRGHFNLLATAASFSSQRFHLAKRGIPSALSTAAASGAADLAKGFAVDGGFAVASGGVTGAGEGEFAAPAVEVVFWTGVEGAGAGVEGCGGRLIESAGTSKG